VLDGLIAVLGSEPVWLARPAEASAQPAIAPWWAFVLGWVLLVALAWRWALRRREHALDPREHAFRALSRKLRLNGRERRAVRRLGSGAGVPPVALLISEHAFSRAQGRADGKNEAAPDPEVVARVRSRVFA